VRNRIVGTCLALVLILPAWAADPPAPSAQPGPGDNVRAIEPSSPLAPFPPDRSIDDQARIGGKTVQYRATVGALPVFDAAGKRAADVVFSAYTVEDGTRRPVTFVFNGGPGAASGFLNIGALGPKRVQFGAKGDAPSDPIRLEDNPNSWLDLTDLVFIDPVGTGFSRSLVGQEETRRAFYGVQQDARYLAGVIYDWLKKNGRMVSDKYVAGESYGGFRTPRIVNELQVWRGVGVKGMALISPYLDGSLIAPTGNEHAGLSPMPWIIRLPSMAAANYEATGIALTPERMLEVEEYARTEFAADYLRGHSDPAALERLVKRVAAYSGLDPAVVRAVGGRLEQNFYLRERFRKQGLVGGRYDINVTYFDPDPWAPELRASDSVAATFTTVAGAMTDFITRIVGWNAPGQYAAFNPSVPQHWEGMTEQPESVSALRADLSLDPKMKVIIAHGYADMSCPYFGSKLILDQLPAMGPRDRVRLRLYPGGHMFYSRPESGAQFKADIVSLYGGAQ
jgi:carboxypeptidase C (cathepsin A)